MHPSLSVCQLLLLLLALAINPSRVLGAVTGGSSSGRAGSGGSSSGGAGSGGAGSGGAGSGGSSSGGASSKACPQGWVELSSCSKDVKADDYVCVKMGPPIKVGEASEREKKRERERERKRMIDR